VINAFEATTAEGYSPGSANLRRVKREAWNVGYDQSGTFDPEQGRSVGLR
jgi:hypothetical protein